MKVKKTEDKKNSEFVAKTKKAMLVIWNKVKKLLKKIWNVIKKAAIVLKDKFKVINIKKGL